MKTQIFLLVLGVFICSKPSIGLQREALEIEYATECKMIEHATDDDLEQFESSFDTPSTETGKCLHACVQEKFEIISDGEVEPDGFVKMATKLYGSDHEEAIAIAQKIDNECTTITHSDRCELAVLLMECAKTAFERMETDAK